MKNLSAVVSAPLKKSQHNMTCCSAPFCSIRAAVSGNIAAAYKLHPSADVSVRCWHWWFRPIKLFTGVLYMSAHCVMMLGGRSYPDITRENFGRHIWNCRKEDSGTQLIVPTDQLMVSWCTSSAPSIMTLLSAVWCPNTIKYRLLQTEWDQLSFWLKLATCCSE